MWCSSSEEDSGDLAVCFIGQRRRVKLLFETVTIVR
jgi:hypothetical protein